MASKPLYRPSPSRATAIVTSSLASKFILKPAQGILHLTHDFLALPFRLKLGVTDKPCPTISLAPPLPVYIAYQKKRGCKPPLPVWPKVP